MSHVQTLRSLFKRYRRPGDIVFAWLCFAGAVFLLSQIFAQTAYKPGAKLFAQPRFWPAVSLGMMSIFAALHLLGSALSERIEGRWREVLLWVQSLEYAGWFILYAVAVPYAGYLPSTVIFALLLAYRLGYRRARVLGIAALCALATVVLFKPILKVNIPAGAIYELLPEGPRKIMLTYF
ncbi:MAG: tripartite tricarboxylate transporter TctB family protein [Sulfitobacter sp.]